MCSAQMDGGGPGKGCGQMGEGGQLARCGQMGAGGAGLSRGRGARWGQMQEHRRGML